MKKESAELSNITSLRPLLSLVLLLFSSFLAPFLFSNTHLKKEKSVLASSITVLLTSDSEIEFSDSDGN